MKMNTTNDREFASMAEAVAHYFKQGFTTSDEGRSETTRIMSKPNDPLAGQIILWHKGFLQVVALNM